MADPVKNLKTPAASFDHEPSSIADYGTEISRLRSEIASLRELIAERGGEAYEKVAKHASTAADYVTTEASSVADTIREHPAATTTLFSLIGAIGFALGYVVATAAADSKQAWYERYLTSRF
jgi:N-methylhydantoinase B/oxoprolinase/acetone carboxylase alpha subunit